MDLKETRKVISYEKMNELVSSSDTLDYVDEVIDGVETRTFGYNVIAPGAFDRCGARNCRGMMFEKSTGKLLALPFFKFFNYGENEDYSAEAVHSWKVIDMYDKVDGSLIYFYKVNGKLFCRTQRMYNNVQSLRAMEIVNGREDYQEFILNVLDRGYTPLFELLSPDVDPHIVRYDFKELVFLGMRNMIDGELVMPTTELYMDLSPSSNVTTILPNNRFDTIDELIDFCQNSNFERNELIEGYTVLFDNNELVKFKTSQFHQIHGLIDDCTRSDVNIAHMIFEGRLDDVLPEIDDNEIAKKFVHAVIHSIADTWNARLKTAGRYCEENRNLTIKEFNEKCRKELDPKIVPIALRHFRAMNDPLAMYPAEHKGMIDSYIAKREWRGSAFFAEYAKRFEGK